MKSRIDVPDNLNAEKNDVRAECTATEMIRVRFIFCLGTCFGFNFGYANIKGAFMSIKALSNGKYMYGLCPIAHTKRDNYGKCSNFPME